MTLTIQHLFHLMRPIKDHNRIIKHLINNNGSGGNDGNDGVGVGVGKFWFYSAERKRQLISKCEKLAFVAQCCTK